MLSLGHLSPSTITPNNLQGLLIEIKDKLPKYLELTNDPKENLWFFYRFLTCSTILYNSRILVVISIPLLDSNNKFEIYQAFNLPMPMQKNHTSIGMVAKYDLDVEYFAVNSERSKYVLLKHQEIQSCTNTFTKFCKIISPVYPINLSKNCITSLFLKKRNDIDKYCRVVVEPNSVLPMASYISSGSWLITTNTPYALPLFVLSFSYYVNIEKSYLVQPNEEVVARCRMSPLSMTVSQLVSAKTEGDVNTSRDVPSAPMLDNSKEEVANNLYPLLKLAEQTVRI
ncbi:unnamed protein product [Mytilus coruscus]|uniref:Uncharacterized protein n=1 Tax=Mytilus coruscus TaxID=42192 RepID=A0A6J8D145_MYTCO|nr:unnamed protein product [Mytilus coruscus]